MTKTNSVRLRIIQDLPRVLAFSMLWLTVCPSLAIADYTYKRIKVPGSDETQATGINARGDIVGVYFTSDGASHGFVLRKGVYTSIEHAGAAGLDARRINSRGDIVGNFEDFAGAQHGFLLSDGQFTPIDRPGASFTFVFGLNDAGDVVGEWDGGGFLLQDGNFRRAPTGGVRGVHYRGFEIQDNGRVLVGTAIGDPVTGFISRRNGEIELIVHPDLPGNCTAVRGLNERGDIVGVTVTDSCDPPFGDSHGFLIRDGEFTPIEFPGAPGTDAFDINDDGVIVGRYLDRDGRVVGFRAEPGM